MPELMSKLIICYDYNKVFLKSLILRGFKTFADPTEIEFSEDARITAIVGPNGCGKSNLLDATRWVLGEDNSRQLRVASLANIIFAGTAARKPLSLAEVSLVFDNTAGKLPVPFTEVSIKRRTFREGESEFFINKNPCRLKDIKDLLLDTGLGEGTYSIITQGQVDAILSSKGEERRAVFEEAAGINKYKTRKLSAEKKLIAAEQNILRISDLKVEVGENLITLEEQAKKAREYLEIQGALKELDIGLSRRLLSQILEKKTKLSQELENIKKQSQFQKESEARDAQELQVLKDNYRKIEMEIDEMLIKLDEEKDRLRDIELDQRFVQSEVQREEASLKDLKGREGKIKEKINEIRMNLEQEQKGLELTDVPLAKSFEAILEQASRLIDGLATILSLLGKEKNISLTLGHSAEKEETYLLKLEMLEEEAVKVSGQREKVEFALQAYSSQLENLRARIEGTKTKHTAAQELSRKKQEKERVFQNIGVLEEKIKSEGMAERRSLTEESSIEISLAKLEGEMSALQGKLSLEYNLSVEEALASSHEISSVSKAKKEVEEMKIKLRSLEPVNLLAIDEFEKGKERLSFIEAQLQDLNSARENLRSLISELDLRAEQTFIQTMQKLSSIFSETFSKLFVGGEAKISLSPGVPALEAEVEISVRPSGRKWLPLPSLSGGERSLSAIAILFSLLKIRPTPFCFLDEVDAALDDANIGRFTEMLKDFSAQSQIIVITHNKRTMAVANNIYGITMEDPGVSKVISMKLAEAV